MAVGWWGGSTPLSWDASGEQAGGREVLVSATKVTKQPRPPPHTAGWARAARQAGRGVLPPTPPPTPTFSHLLVLIQSASEASGPCRGAPPAQHRLVLQGRGEEGSGSTGWHYQIRGQGGCSLPPHLLCHRHAGPPGSLRGRVAQLAHACPPPPPPHTHALHAPPRQRLPCTHHETPPPALPLPLWRPPAPGYVPLLPAPTPPSLHPPRGPPAPG